jgi:hypothetical protein
MPCESRLLITEEEGRVRLIIMLKFDHDVGGWGIEMAFHVEEIEDEGESLQNESDSDDDDVTSSTPEYQSDVDTGIE